jgi:hypothetical protein
VVVELLAGNVELSEPACGTGLTTTTSRLPASGRLLEHYADFGPQPVLMRNL